MTEVQQLSAEEVQRFHTEHLQPTHNGADQILSARRTGRPHARAAARYAMRDSVQPPDQALPQSLDERLLVPASLEFFADFSEATGIAVPTFMQRKDEYGNYQQVPELIHGAPLVSAVENGLVPLAQCDRSLHKLPDYIQNTFVRGGGRYLSDVYAAGQYMYGTSALPLHGEKAQIWMVDVSPITEDADPANPADARFAVGLYASMADTVLALEAAARKNPKVWEYDNVVNDPRGLLWTRHSIADSLDYFKDRYKADANVQELSAIALQALEDNEPLSRQAQRQIDHLMFE